MTKLAALFTRAQLVQRQTAARLGISPAALNLILKRNQWPRRDVEALRMRIRDFLIAAGIDLAEVSAALKPETSETPEKDTLMIRKQGLSPKAKRHFGLVREIFTDDLRDADDVYLSENIRYVRETMLATAKHGGFLGVVGESGSGKSTLRRDLRERIRTEKLQIILIEPYVLGMEDNDKQGKRLKSSHIAEAILYAVAPAQRPHASPEARFRQLHKVLKDSYQSHRHCLIIEEAHSLSYPTIKHLKRFFELEDGFARLLSIILIGQPELKDKLSETVSEVREVVQRIELLQVDPLEDLEGYVRHRCIRADADYDKLFDSTALTALSSRLQGTPSRNDGPVARLTFPLAVGNYLTKAINEAAELGMSRVTGQVVCGI